MWPATSETLAVEGAAVPKRRSRTAGSEILLPEEDFEEDLFLFHWWGSPLKSLPDFLNSGTAIEGLFEQLELILSETLTSEDVVTTTTSIPAVVSTRHVTIPVRAKVAAPRIRTLLDQVHESQRRPIIIVPSRPSSMNPDKGVSICEGVCEIQ